MAQVSTVSEIPKGRRRWDQRHENFRDGLVAQRKETNCPGASVFLFRSDQGTIRDIAEQSDPGAGGRQPITIRCADGGGRCKHATESSRAGASDPSYNEAPRYFVSAIRLRPRATVHAALRATCFLDGAANSAVCSAWIGRLEGPAG